MVWCPSNLLSTLIKAHWKAGFSSESNFYRDPSLPESKALPSVIFFAEYILSDTWQTTSLPSVKLKTLGKDSDTRQTLCLVSALLKNTRQTFWHSANILTLGNSTEKHSANSGTRQIWEKHSANYGTRQTSRHVFLHCPLAECPLGNTRQTIYLFFLTWP